MPACLTTVAAIHLTLTNFLHRKHHELFGTLPVWRSARRAHPRPSGPPARAGLHGSRPAGDPGPVPAPGDDRRRRRPGQPDRRPPRAHQAHDLRDRRHPGRTRAWSTRDADATTAGRDGHRHHRGYARARASPRARCGRGSATSWPGSTTPMTSRSALAALDDALDERRAAQRRAARERAGGTGDDELDPSAVAVPRPAPAQGVRRVRRVAGHDAHHRRHPAHRARGRRRRDRHRATRALWPLLALLVGLGAVNFVFSYFRRFPAAGSRSTCSTTCAPRSSSSSASTSRATTSCRPASSCRARSSDVALIQGFLQFLPDRRRQHLAVRGVARRDAHAVAAALAGDARGRARAAVRVAAAAHVGVPRELGRAAEGRRRRQRRRRRRHRRAGREGVRAGGARARPRSPTPPRICIASRVRLGEPAGAATSRRCRRSRRSARSRCSRSAAGWRSRARSRSARSSRSPPTCVPALAPVRQLAAILAVGQQARAGAERIFDLLDSTPLVQERPTRADLAVTARRGRVRARDVRLPASEPVLRDFSLTVAPGETVALVGARARASRR